MFPYKDKSVSYIDAIFIHKHTSTLDSCYLEKTLIDKKNALT